MDENKLNDIVNNFGKHVIFTTTTNHEYEGVIHIQHNGWLYYVDTDGYECRIPYSVIEHIKCIGEKFNVEEIMDVEKKVFKRQKEEMDQLQKEDEAKPNVPDTRTGYS